MKAKNKKLSILVGTLTVFLIAGITYWMLSGNYESTDNAQLDGDIYTIKSRIASYVDHIYFEDNQLIQKGDTLFKLNTKELEANLKQAEAALTNAQTGLEISDNDALASVNTAKASKALVQANNEEIKAAEEHLAQANENLTRNEALYKINGVTQQQLQNSQHEVTAAKAQLQQAINRRQSAIATVNSQLAVAKSEEAQIGTANALIAQRQAELDLAQYELSHAFILAPCTGTVTRRTVQVGNLVSSGQTLCAMVNQENLWVTANIKESQLEAIQLGQEAKVTVDAYPDVTLKGTVQSFGGATGAKFALLPPDNATGNFVKVVQRIPIRIIIEKPQNLNSSTLLFPGLSANVSIKTD